MSLLLRLHEEHGFTLVTATHDAGLSSRCQHVMKLIDGRLSPG